MFSNPPVPTKQSIPGAAFLSSLIRMQHSLYKKETADWLYARESALSLTNPSSYDLAQFYRDMETDLFIKGQKQQRVNRIKNRKVKVTSKSTKEKNEEKTDLINGKKWFRDFRQAAMDAKFQGQRVAYFQRGKRGEPVLKVVWPEHVIPAKGIIVKNPYDSTGMSYLEPPLSNYVIALGDADNIGLYENLAYAYILRKHSWASWDEFEELFGVPLRWIKTTSTDKAVLDQLESFAITMGSSNYAIVPGNAEMDVKEGNAQDAFQVFNEKRKAVNEEVAMFINGHAESTNDKGSRAKSETIIHKTQDEILDDDKADVLTAINDDLLPMLANLFGFPFTDDDIVEWDDTTQLQPKEKAEIYTAVSGMGFELDQTDVEEALGVKIIGKKEVAALPPKHEPGKPDPKKKKPENKSEYAIYMKLHSDLFKAYNHLNEEEEE
jgi:hypothetical protein